VEHSSEVSRQHRPRRGFEAEPKILDPGSPWLYNTLEFNVVDLCGIHADHGCHYMPLRFREEAKMKDAALFTKPRIRVIGGNAA
jgi:hypothetical protein